MSKAKGKYLRSRLADMSLPPEQRGRRRKQGRMGGTPPAQMSHALGSRGARWRRDGERALENERALEIGRRLRADEEDPVLLQVSGAS